MLLDEQHKDEQRKRLPIVIARKTEVLTISVAGFSRWHGTASRGGGDEMSTTTALLLFLLVGAFRVDTGAAGLAPHLPQHRQHRLMRSMTDAKSLLSCCYVTFIVCVSLYLNIALLTTIAG